MTKNKIVVKTVISGMPNIQFDGTVERTTLYIIIFLCSLGYNKLTGLG